MYNKKKKARYWIDNKEYIKARRKKHKLKYPWKYTLQDIKKRCNNCNNKRYKDYGRRGIKCLITEEELKKLWFRDKAYNMKKPSIDRIDNNGNYELSNCRFIELSINSSRNKFKQIEQYDFTGKLVKVWNSITEASNNLNIPPNYISAVLHGRQKTTRGFIWKLK